jgi:integrase
MERRARWEIGVEGGNERSGLGIYLRGDRLRIRVRAVDPRSGRAREANRIFGSVGIAEACEQRVAMRRELEQRLREPPRSRVVDFGRHWLAIKKTTIDPGTYDRYQAALEDHAFKSFGRMPFIDLRGLHVQNWINEELARGYRVATVKGWFRTLRTMVQDAAEDLALPRDPTRRIRFPIGDEREETNALLPGQLARFLDQMKRRYPQHYALAATLALTGLRFCHASALRWEDFDQDRRILRVRRRQLRGRVGPVTLVKRAPKEYPVSPDLMAILRSHQRAHRPGRPRRRGWMFANRRGGLRCPASLQTPWRRCLLAVRVEERFTVHGMRRTFVDLARRAKVDSVVTRSLTGHVTEKMRIHYSSVGLDEKRIAVALIAKLVRNGEREGDTRRSGRRGRRASARYKRAG